MNIYSGVESGFIVHNNEAIYGTGITEVDAWASAEEWTDEHGTAGMICIPATGALLRHVANDGGAISWGMCGKVACTIEEEAAA